MAEEGVGLLDEPKLVEIEKRLDRVGDPWRRAAIWSEEALRSGNGVQDEEGRRAHRSGDERRVEPLDEALVHEAFRGMYGHIQAWETVQIQPGVPVVCGDHATDGDSSGERA